VHVGPSAIAADSSLIYRNSLVGLDEGISHGGMSAVIKFTARK